MDTSTDTGMGMDTGEATEVRGLGVREQCGGGGGRQWGTRVQNEGLIGSDMYRIGARVLMLWV